MQYGPRHFFSLYSNLTNHELDSIMSKFTNDIMYFKGKSVVEKKAQSIYKSWGKWKYLAYWFELWEMYNEEQKKKP